MIKFDLLLVLFTGAMQVRSQIVYRFRTKLLDRMRQVSDAEIAAGNFMLWDLRYLAFDQVGYGRMMLLFWRSPKSFYRGTMLEPLTKAEGTDNRCSPR